MYIHVRIYSSSPKERTLTANCFSFFFVPRTRLTHKNNMFEEKPTHWHNGG
jgi:hypothetical protein